MSAKARRTVCPVLLGFATLLASAGCSLCNDPHYNRFAPESDRLHLRHRADAAVTSAERHLDNGRQRLDNIIE